MAILRLHIEKDSTIYSEYPVTNTGKDQIIEIANYLSESGTNEVIRALLKYDIDKIDELIQAYSIPSNFTSSLHLTFAEGSEIPTDFSIDIFPASGSWEEGRGQFGDIPLDKSGVSWQYRFSGETSAWKTNNFTANTTGSFNNLIVGGGNWYYSSSVDLPISTNIKNKTQLDSIIDISSLVNIQLDNEISNDGILLKLDNTTESNQNRNLRIKFFSCDTNTIYAPYVSLKWDDSTYNTGSLSVVDSDNLYVKIKNNKEKYTTEEEVRFRLTARPKYPVRTFSTSSIYLTNYALPTQTYWSVIDEYTNNVVIPFDQFNTKVSCDSTGPFFKVFMNMFEPERFYRFLFKTVVDGSTVIFNNVDNIIKVVKNA